MFERHISVDAKLNLKCFFQYYSRKGKVREEVKCIKNNKGELLYKNKEIADALNGNFIEFVEFFVELLILNDMLNTQNVLANIEMGDKEILDKLQKLKTNKAAGPDGVFPMVRKDLSEIIFKPLI